MHSLQVDFSQSTHIFWLSVKYSQREHKKFSYNCLSEIIYWIPIFVRLGDVSFNISEMKVSKIFPINQIN